MNNTLKAILASIGAYFYILILARIMGKKLIAEMTFFDFIVAITVGTLTANIALGQGDAFTYSIISVFVLSALTVAIGFWHLKSPTLNKLVSSEPVALISNGKIVEENMKKVRISLPELKSLLREKSAFNLTDVEFAFMEIDGKLSVLKKPEQTPLTPSNINQIVVNKGFTKDIIMDGEIQEENMRDAKLDRNWLNAQLNSLGINSVAEVFYAGIDNTNTLYVTKKSNKKEKHGQYGIE